MEGSQQSAARRCRETGGINKRCYSESAAHGKYTRATSESIPEAADHHPHQRSDECSWRTHSLYTLWTLSPLSLGSKGSATRRPPVLACALGSRTVLTICLRVDTGLRCCRFNCQRVPAFRFPAIAKSATLICTEIIAMKTKVVSHGAVGASFQQCWVQFEENLRGIEYRTAPSEAIQS